MTEKCNHIAYIAQDGVPLSVVLLFSRYKWRLSVHSCREQQNTTFGDNIKVGGKAVYHLVLRGLDTMGRSVLGGGNISLSRFTVLGKGQYVSFWCFFPSASNCEEGKTGIAESNLFFSPPSSVSGLEMVAGAGGGAC